MVAGSCKSTAETASGLDIFAGRPCFPAGLRPRAAGRLMPPPRGLAAPFFFAASGATATGRGGANWRGGGCRGGGCRGGGMEAEAAALGIGAAEAAAAARWVRAPAAESEKAAGSSASAGGGREAGGGWSRGMGKKWRLGGWRADAILHLLELEM